MDVLDTLKNEHGLIRRYLENLSLALEKLEDGTRPPRSVFDNGVRFARSFVDTLHHFKEEHVLFVKLAQHLGGELDPQIDMLRHQHERGREHIAGIARAIEGYARGDERSTADLIEHVSAHISLLRHHIHTEDHVFYPKVRELLSDDDLALVRAEFDQQRASGAAFEESHKLVVDMGSALAHL